MLNWVTPRTKSIKTSNSSILSREKSGNHGEV
jgi:hypothetical protein